MRVNYSAKKQFVNAVQIALARNAVVFDGEDGSLYANAKTLTFLGRIGDRDTVVEMLQEAVTVSNFWEYKQARNWRESDAIVFKSDGGSFESQLYGRLYIKVFNFDRTVIRVVIHDDWC